MTKEIIKPPEADQAELITQVNGSPFVISGNVELIQDMYQDELKAYKTRPVAKAAVAAVQAPQTVIDTKDGYIDTSTLAPREILRRKISAKVYDLSHRTNMYGLLVEKINEDRDVAFARKLGLITTTHCQKHEKMVAELQDQS